jgi:hypothetical protein
VEETHLPSNNYEVRVVAHHLRRGVSRAQFSSSLNPAPRVMAAVTEVLPQTIQLDELIYEQAKDL